MPVTLHAPLFLLGLFWIAFAIKFYRSVRVGKVNTAYARALWFSSFLGGLVITFSGKEMEQYIDLMSGGLPLTFYTKFLCALLIIHTLYFMLHPTMVVSSHLDRILRYGCLMTILVGFVSIPVFLTVPPGAKEQLRYGLIALRDLVVSVYMVIAFIPMTYQTWQKEAVVPMKFKHFVGLMFDFSYLLLAIGNILTFLGSFSNLQAAAFIDQAFKPAMSLCILFFMIAGLPHRILARLFWIQRWWILRRLRHIEAKISSGRRPIHNEVQTSIEGHIYRTVIFILDHYSVLQKGSYQALYHQIASAISLYPDYSQLVKQLAKLA